MSANTHTEKKAPTGAQNYGAPSGLSALDKLQGRERSYLEDAEVEPVHLLQCQACLKGFCGNRLRRFCANCQRTWRVVGLLSPREPVGFLRRVARLSLIYALFADWQWFRRLHGGKWVQYSNVGGLDGAAWVRVKEWPPRLAAPTGRTPREWWA